jgi:hypothetical protein
MITKNIGMLLLAIYLIAVGILTLTGLGIGIITGALALVAGIHSDRPLGVQDSPSNLIISLTSFGPMPLSSCLKNTKASVQFVFRSRTNSDQRFTSSSL